jgi:hypothetical protein
MKLAMLLALLLLAGCAQSQPPSFYVHGRTGATFGAQ